MSKQATIKVHAADWSIIGRGKSKQYTAAIKAGVAAPGDRVKLTSKAGVVTTGTLVDNVRPNTDGVDRWTFTADDKSPEQRASDRALRAMSTAAYWSSDKGVETAAKIAARTAKQADVVETPATPVIDAPVSTSVPTLVDLIVANMAAGMDAAAAAMTAQATITALSVAPAAVTTPAVTTSTKRPRTPGQLANDARLRRGAAAVAPTVPMATTAQRQPCQACGKQDRLTSHAGEPGLLVCASCLTADTDTVRNRAIRRATKLSAK